MEPVRLERTFHLASSPADLWPLVSNTDRVNRALGLPQNAIAGVDPKDYSRQVSASLFGIPLRWKECPFDYVDERSYEVVREFHTGPFTRFQGRLEMAAEDGGTAMTLRASLWPASEWARPFAALFAKKAMADMIAIYERIDESLAKLGAFPAPPRTMSAVDEDLLAARAEALLAARVDKTAAERLIAHIKDSPDDELRGMRPFELADRWP